MATPIKSVSMALAAAVLLASVLQPSEAAVDCRTVASYMSSCIPYVTGQGPLGGCCNGVKGLYAAAQTTPDRQSVCNCLKSLAGSVTYINYGKASGLPGQCGVSIPYQISPSTDCTKVQ